MLAMGFMLTATTASAQMTKKGKTYTVNTTTLCNARGFKGTTPLLVTFKGGKRLCPTTTHHSISRKLRPVCLPNTRA